MISVLHEHRDEVVIDLHSANRFDPRDGHINSALGAQSIVAMPMVLR